MMKRISLFVAVLLCLLAVYTLVLLICIPFIGSVMMVVVMVWIYEFDVREREVSALAAQFTLPLAVDIGFGDGYDIAHLKLQCGFVVRVWHTCLLHSRQRR